MLTVKLEALAAMLLLEHKVCVDKSGIPHNDKLTLRTPVGNDGIKRLMAFCDLSGIKPIKVPWAKSTPNGIIMGKTFVMMIFNRKEIKEKSVVEVAEDSFAKYGIKLGEEMTPPKEPKEAKILKLVHSASEAEFAENEKKSLDKIDELINDKEVSPLLTVYLREFLVSRGLVTAFYDFMEKTTATAPQEADDASTPHDPTASKD